MLRLDSTLRKLEIVLAGAVTTNQLPVLVSYSDKTATTYDGATQVASTNGATPVTICTSPAAAVVRDVDCVDVVNTDTVSAVVTIGYNDNSTLYTLFKVTLTTGDQLTYTHGQGWKVVDGSGAMKSLSSDVVTLTGTQTLSNKTLTSPSSTGTWTHSGDVLLSGSGKRITGDFSNATIANRVMFQTSTVNGPTSVGVFPNGTSVVSNYRAFNSTDTNNSAYAGLAILGTEARVESATVGTGTYLPMTFYTGGAERMRIDTSGNVLVTNAGGSLGYGTGAGGTVTQATSKATTVTLNKPSGRITMMGDSLAAGAVVTFLFNNSLLSGVDELRVSQATGTAGAYSITTLAGAGAFYISVRNVSAAALAEALVLNFEIGKGAIS